MKTLQEASRKVTAKAMAELVGAPADNYNEVTASSLSAALNALKRLDREQRDLQALALVKLKADYDCYLDEGDLLIVPDTDIGRDLSHILKHPNVKLCSGLAELYVVKCSKEPKFCWTV